MSAIPALRSDIASAFAATSDQELKLRRLTHLRLGSEVLPHDFRTAAWEVIDNEVVQADAQDDYRTFIYYRAILGGMPIIATVGQDLDGSYFFGSFRRESVLQAKYDRQCAEAEAGQQARIQQIAINGRMIPVQFAPGVLDDSRVGWEHIQSWHVFVQFARSIDPRLEVQNLTIQSVDFFGKRIGFLKMSVEIIDGATRNKFSRIVMLRGGAVAILTILSCLGQEYVVLVKQARVAVGHYELPEIPAGMLDGAVNPLAKAVEELGEELGIAVDEHDLVDLTVLAGFANGVYTSPGALDEFCSIVLYQKEVTPAELASFRGRKTGLAAEDEAITTELLSLKDSQLPPDAKTLAALCLYDRLKAQGKI